MSSKALQYSLMKQDENDKEKIKLLNAALALVGGEGGIAPDLLERAAEKAKLSPALAGLLFPEGIAGILVFFSKQRDKLIRKEIEGATLSDKKIREKIIFAVQQYLRSYESNRVFVHKGLYFLSVRGKALTAFQMVYGSADMMWRAIGDTSTDGNFYSKRLVLSGVIASTLLHWLSDESENYAETEGFLRRRIEDVMAFEGVKMKLRNAMPDSHAIIEMLAKISP